MISLMYNQSGIQTMLDSENFSSLSDEYYKGEDLDYHTVYIGNGYVWLEYLRNNGKSGYIPIREYKNGNYGRIWGTVK